MRGTRGFLFPNVQLVGVLRIRTYNTRENMYANQLEGEARTYIASSLRTSPVHITRERIWLSCLNKIMHSYVAVYT